MRVGAGCALQDLSRGHHRAQPSLQWHVKRTTGIADLEDFIEPVDGILRLRQGSEIVAGAKFERAPTTLVESQRVETPMRVSWTHMLDRCY